MAGGWSRTLARRIGVQLLIRCLASRIFSLFLRVEWVPPGSVEPPADSASRKPGARARGRGCNLDHRHRHALQAERAPAETASVASFRCCHFGGSLMDLVSITIPMNTYQWLFVPTRTPIYYHMESHSRCTMHCVHSTYNHRNPATFSLDP